MTPEQSEKLRAKFPPEAIGQKPQPYVANSPKGFCSECHQKHGLPAMHLDFVGHALVTDRLLQVDPEWTWEPMGYDDRGVPALDGAGNLWIWLTIAGVRRPGVGDGPDAKQKISDALRNGAMRFGVALDLWSKQELQHAAQDSAAEPAASSDLEEARATLLTASRKVKPDLEADDRFKFVRAALEARGLDGTKTEDLLELAEEWAA